MTKDEVLKLALEALEIPWNAPYVDGCDLALGKKVKAITAIYEALAQPEHGWTPERIAGMARLKEAQDKKLAQPEQEPVGEIVDAIEGAFKCSFTKMLPVGTKLYTTPPQRKPLSDEEIETYRYMIDWTAHWSYINFARAIEAAHGIKEKNT